jgi:hypothetical protein
VLVRQHFETCTANARCGVAAYRESRKVEIDVEGKSSVVRRKSNCRASLNVRIRRQLDFEIRWL